MKIPILHLEEGYHHFEEVITGGSLHFYRQEIYPNDLKITVDLNKFDQNMSCQISISTLAEYHCDRCLAEYQKDFIESIELLFHIGSKEIETEEEDVISISPDVKEIDITPYIEESLILAVPMKLLCKEDCKGICPGCGVDLNFEKCHCSEKNPDTRWDKLLEVKRQKQK
jgi:uncharacterized protein